MFKKFLLIISLAFVQIAICSPNLAPINPFLANSISAMTHFDSAMQDAVAVPGPVDKTRQLGTDEIEYLHLGPAYFAGYWSSPYADGKRVIWVHGLDRLVKVDPENLHLLSAYAFPDSDNYTEQHAEDVINKLDHDNRGLFAELLAVKETIKYGSLTGLYVVLDRDNTYYIANKAKEIIAYGDVVPGNRASAIEMKRKFKLPEKVSGQVVGMNLTYDGWLILVTDTGWVTAISRDFGQVHTVRMKFSEEAEKEGIAANEGWVRNSYPIDKNGGIYIVSNDHMHKVVWNGERLSIDEADGAWTEPYSNNSGRGSGSTPSLMGFGEEDKFVVLTDGDKVMNLVLFWRDKIPDSWKGIAGIPSRRIAGMLPVNMNNPNIKAIQSEQSTVVAGYGAMVVNNTPRNIPWYMPGKLQFPVYSGLLGSDPEHQPIGVQKFVWDPQEMQLKYAWYLPVSSPNGVPLVSLGSNMAYLIGARDNQWTFEAIDWETGESKFHYIIGGQRFNNLYSNAMLDQDGYPTWGTTWGRVRLTPKSWKPQ